MEGAPRGRPPTPAQPSGVAAALDRILADHHPGATVAPPTEKAGAARVVRRRHGLGLEDRLSTLVRNLSGGQRQALGLVMATIAEPNILLLDEHAAALDPRTAAQVMRLTEIVIRKHELTTVMVTHNMQHAIRWGDRLLMMHLGRIILDISGEKKAGLTIQELVKKFHEAAGDEISEDRLILA